MEGTNKVIQIWKKENIQGDWDDVWTWTVEFDDVTGTAIPVSYAFHFLDYVHDEDTNKSYDYTFSQLEKEDESFKLSDYCINV